MIKIVSTVLLKRCYKTTRVVLCNGCDCIEICRVVCGPTGLGLRCRAIVNIKRLLWCMYVSLAELTTSTRHLLCVKRWNFPRVKVQLHTYRSYAKAINRKSYRGEKGTNTVKEKTDAQRSKRLNEWAGVLIVIKCNILIGSYCLWCKGKCPKEKEKSHCKFVHIVIILKMSWKKECEDRSQRVRTVHSKFSVKYKQSCEELYI